MIRLDRCNGSYNVPYDSSSKVRVANKTENENLNAFNAMRKNNIKALKQIKTKALTNHILCDSKCKYE